MRGFLASVEDIAPNDKPASRDVAGGVPGRDQRRDDGVAADVRGALVLEHGVKLLPLCLDHEGLAQRPRDEPLQSLSFQCHF